MKSYWTFWTRCLDFSGKTSRREFAFAFLWYVFVGAVVMILEGVITSVVFQSNTQMLFLYQIYGLFGVIALASMSMRRLRDAGYSWKSFLWLLIPVIGGIAFIARLCGKSIESK